MNDYVIVTDSTSDLPLNITKEIGVEVFPMKIIMEGKTYMDGALNHAEFYDKIRNKAVASTSQINPGEFEEYFSKYLEKGRDVLYICFSSGLSGTYNSACIAAKELQKKYPSNRIIVVDSLSASLGEGCLVHFLAKMKRQGATMENLEQWANKNKNKICHWFVVDDLKNLQRGGRISQASAVLGGVMGIKPVLCFDNKGKLCIAEKARGKAKALQFMLLKLESCGVDVKNQTVYLSHADCVTEAHDLAEEIKNKFGVKQIIINNITPVIGSHTGAGTIALFFLGNKR